MSVPLLPTRTVCKVAPNWPATEAAKADSNAIDASIAAMEGKCGAGVVVVR